MAEKLTKDEAVKAMLNEGFVPDGTKAEREKWAAKAYTFIKKESEPLPDEEPQLPDAIKNTATNPPTTD